MVLQGWKNLQESEKYNCLRMDITLNRMGYNYEDMQDLFEEPFSTLYPTRIGFRWYPSAVGHDLIDFKLVLNFVLTGAATVLIGKITSDLYDWAKESLKKVIHKKNWFSESRVTLVFKDMTVNIYTFEKDDILETISNIDVIIDHLNSKQISEESYDIEFEELNILRQKFKNKI